MQHRLQDIKTYYICPDHNEKYHTRKLHMDALLTSLGFTNFQHYKSGSEAYPVCLNNATINILQKNLDESILILEDDIECSGALEFTMPEGVDAIYFGLSTTRGSMTINRFEGPTHFESYSDKQVRLLNMLSGHAILYISRAYKEAVIATLEAHVNTDYYNDVLMARLHHKFHIYANRMPAFWQSNRFNVPNNLERTTKITFAYPHNTIMNF
jgi:hypothetical protein